MIGARDLRPGMERLRRYWILGLHVWCVLEGSNGARIDIEVCMKYGYILCVHASNSLSRCLFTGSLPGHPSSCAWVLVNTWLA